MNIRPGVKAFFFPSITRWFTFRLFLVGGLAFFFFTYICIPFVINGHSMEPTYSDGGVNFCFRLPYLYTSPQKYDVVAIRFSGIKRMLLKRIVAVEDDVVEFRKGKLHVNGKPAPEPYVQYPCTWDLSPRKVKAGNVYVVGDNRSVSIHKHQFGQTPKSRIIGKPLW